jgi:glutaredoxin
MFCNRAKQFLSQKGVPFTEWDVSSDEEALSELERLGYRTTPVIVIDGEVVVGFDQKRLEELLKGK